MAAKKPIHRFMQAAYRQGEKVEPPRRFGLSARTLALAGIAILVAVGLLTGWWLYRNTRADHLIEDGATPVHPWQYQPLPASTGPASTGTDANSPASTDPVSNSPSPTDPASNSPVSVPDSGVGVVPSDLGAGAVGGENVVVHVSGAVHHPGVVQLSPGDRVIDAVELAGGMTSHADESRINLAAHVGDGEYVYVPALGEELPADLPVIPSGGVRAENPYPPDAPQGTDPGSGKVNLNTADASALETLPGVGPVLSERIITWRQDHGPFTDISQLMNVSGIGPATFNRLQELITL